MRSNPVRTGVEAFLEGIEAAAGPIQGARERALALRVSMERRRFDELTLELLELYEAEVSSPGQRREAIRRVQRARERVVRRMALFREAGA